jgi:aspartyl-tRNA synthetase
VRARVNTVRAKGKSCFLVLRRGLYTVQAVLFQTEQVPADMIKYVSKINEESIVEIEGQVQGVQQPTKCTQSQVELAIQRIHVVSSPQSLPFQLADAARNVEDGKEGEGPTVKQDVRLDYRWVDLRTPANHAIFRLQSAVGTYFREFFLRRDFVEIHTPKITPGVSEGGAEVFRLKYFGQDACMAQSPQLYKQMAAASSDLFRVFEIGPVFRAENSLTHRHMCEFEGLDFEMEIKEHYHEVTDTLSELFVFIFDRINQNHKAELAAVRAQYPSEPLLYSHPCKRITFDEAAELLRQDGEKFDKLIDFTTPQEKRLGRIMKEKFNTELYIVDRYPLLARPFYTMPCADNPNYTNSYDVFLRGEEITSGAQRVHDPELLLRRATECNIPHSNIAAYVDSFRSGAPPHGGAGIGLERVTMLFLGLNNIRKTCMFPRTPDRLTP